MKKMYFTLMVSILLLAACNNEKKTDETAATSSTKDSTEIKEERNKQTALASIDGIIAGDVNKTLQDVAPDAVDYGDGSMPAVKSKDSIMVYLKMWRDALSEYKGDNIMAFADGDNVVVWGTWSATFKTDFMGMKTAGKKIKVNDADIFKFNSDGKITEHHNIQSSAEMLRQLEAQK